MLNKLQAVVNKYEELCFKSEQADFYADPKKAAKLLREKNDLEPIVEAFQAYRQAEQDMLDAEGEVLLIRAHGEPPQTYARASSLGFQVIDCTCPVVLKLQQRIKDAYIRQKENGEGQIIIFGKIGHAEVLGLIGQTDGTAVVVEDIFMLEEAIGQGRIRLDVQTEVFSQTTKSPAEYRDFAQDWNRTWPATTNFR